MTRTRFTILAVVVAVMSVSGARGGNVPPPKVPVSIDVKSSAAEQLKSVTPLIRNLEAAKSDGERQVALLTAAAHLEMIPRQWPDQRQQVLEAGLLEARLFAEFHAPRNALDVIARTEPYAKGTPRVVELRTLKARCLSLLGRNAEAEAEFSAAASIPARSPRERIPLLNEMERFYSLQHRDAELSRMLREDAQLPHDDITAMLLVHRSMEANLRIPNLAEARTDYRDLAERYRRALQRPVAPFGSGEAALLDMIKKDLDRYSDQLH